MLISLIVFLVCLFLIVLGKTSDAMKYAGNKPRKPLEEDYIKDKAFNAAMAEYKKELLKWRWRKIAESIEDLYDNCVIYIISTTIGIVAISVCLIGFMTARADVSDNLATYKYYEKALNEGYIWNSQSCVANEQARIAKILMTAEKHPFMSFYSKKDAQMLYDIVMKFEIPKFENTREYAISTKRVIETKDGDKKQ